MNTIKRNEELHAYYQKHSRTYKLKNMHKKSVKPLNLTNQHFGMLTNVTIGYRKKVT